MNCNLEGHVQVFHEIDAVEPLKKLASSPNTVASKLAAEALKVIGEKIPHKLTQQVPLWTVEDVSYWVSQVNHIPCVHVFQPLTPHDPISPLPSSLVDLSFLVTHHLPRSVP